MGMDIPTGRRGDEGTNVECAESPILLYFLALILHE